MKITGDILYVGVEDRGAGLFERQFEIPDGMAYNSYLILDERPAVMDSVGEEFAGEWLGNIAGAMGGKSPGCLIVQHMEPDHSGSIRLFAEAYPEAEIVASARAFAMMKGFFGTDFGGRQRAAAEGDSLPLGRHTLEFIAAPMVHWPEVIMTYDRAGRALFSADAFGKFGVAGAGGGWADEARRYYFAIVGKYGAQVKNVLKKAAALDIGLICPLHGPVLSGDTGYYFGLYGKWAGYEPEEEGVAIAYASIYGNTEGAALRLAEKLRRRGCKNVAVHDLARFDISGAVADAFRYSRLVLAAPTYNAGLFPFMRNFIGQLAERNFGGRTVAFIENGSWAPSAAKIMRGMLEGCGGIRYADTTVSIRSAADSGSEAQLEALARELCGGEGA